MLVKPCDEIFRFCGEGGLMISVALAAYKGEKYILEQVSSILEQLGENDELIISDDCPHTETYDVLSDLIQKDKRIVYVEGPGKGVIKNFEHAIALVKGDYIFLADQDDVWCGNKVERVMKAFAGGADIVLHNAAVTDGELCPSGIDAFTINHTATGTVKNIIKNSYQGCCMAFSAQLREHILPFPEKLPMHDQWIGLVGEKFGRVELIEEPLILYRRHGENVSGNGSTALTKLKWRAQIISALISRR